MNTQDQDSGSVLKPVAYLYENEEGSKELIFNCNSEYARRLLELGYREMPLFATTPLPSPDAAEIVALLTKAVGDISAALSLAGKERAIARWTEPYVAAINAFDAALQSAAPQPPSQQRERPDFPGTTF